MTVSLTLCFMAASLHDVAAGFARFVRLPTPRRKRRAGARSLACMVSQVRTACQQESAKRRCGDGIASPVPLVKDTDQFRTHLLET